MTLAELFPDADFRFPLNLEKGSAASFYGPTAEHAEILAERRRYLEATPDQYALALPESDGVLAETGRLFREWGCLSKGDKPAEGALGSCLALGRFMEPDFVLLRRGDDGVFRVVAGALCFPSHWSLPDKAGLPLASVHGIVPGLNEAIGSAIDRVLQKLRPEAPLFRSNWGLQLGRERNDHPARRLPRLDANSPLAEVWVRVEHQALVALPESGGILFGIRVAHHALAEFTASPSLARGLHRALATMPEPMLRYKGLAALQPRLLRTLSAAANLKH